MDTYTKENDDAAIEIAQRLWAKLYDESRSTSARGKRIDKGGQKRNGDSLSEVAWLKRRRREVDEIVSRQASSSAGSTDVNNRAITLAEQTWSEKHRKEERFQIEKQRRRLLDGLARGLLSPRRFRRTSATISCSNSRKTSPMTRSTTQHKCGRRAPWQSCHGRVSLACGSSSTRAWTCLLRP